MENNETTHTPSPQPKWFHNAWISRGTLVIAALFFLLPFMNINCSGNKLASIRGIDMVIGTEIKPAGPKAEENAIKEDPAKAAVDSLSMALKTVGDSLNLNIEGADSLTAGLNALTDSLTAGLSSLGDSLDKAFKGENNPFAMPMDMMGGQDKKIDPNPIAIGAFAFILFAFVFTFFKNRVFAIIAGIFALISAAALFFLQVQITAEIQKQMGGAFAFVPITVEFTNFYWFCLIFTLVASIFSFVRSSFKTT
ncbi:MAG: hypothetical protein ACXVC6_07060 [Bacteroidia bacterium]